MASSSDSPEAYGQGSEEHRLEVQRLRQEVNALKYELHQIQQQLQNAHENEQYYAALTVTSPVGIFRTDASGRYIYVNDRWCEITGVSAAAASADQWCQALHPYDRDRVQQAWQEAVEQQTGFRLEYRFRHPNGQVVWVLAQARPEYDAQQHFLGYVGTLTNITDRKQYEQALKDSEERFRATFEQAAVGVAHVAPDGRWMRVNQRLCDIVGYTREELLDLTFRDITYPDDLQMDEERVQQVVAGIIDHYSLEKRYIHKQGIPVWVEITVSLVRDTPVEDSQLEEQPLPLGDPKYFIVVVESIEERKQAELMLQERAKELSYLNTVLSRTTTLLKKRNQELDQFAYVASHDLKAPLRAIANLSEWIEEDLAGTLPAENQRQMDLLRGRVHRMEALIDGLLAYSRVGRSQIQPEWVDVGAMLRGLVDSLDPPSGFVITIAPTMPTLMTKRSPLQQVFLNLISNAIKHHPRPDGQVHITVQDTGSYYEFAVTDDGDGIDPRYHSKIFQIFQTLEARDTRENTGMGLSIVKKIVETEGGSIQLESSLGEGATFRFLWPKVETED
jgi:PAS domain S-box-containing protein